MNSMLKKAFAVWKIKCDFQKPKIPVNVIETGFLSLEEMRRTVLRKAFERIIVVAKQNDRNDEIMMWKQPK